MGINRRATRVPSGALLLAAAALACATAARADTPRMLCAAYEDSPATVDATLEPQVRAEADRAESAIAAAGQRSPDFNFSAMTPALGADPSARTRAAYCLAVGELARRGGYGTALDAPGYLQVAFLYAQQARATDLAALAAYRLGMAISASPIAAGGRGADANASPAASRTIMFTRRRTVAAREPRGAAACEALLVDHNSPGVALSCSGRISCAMAKRCEALAAMRSVRAQLNRQHAVKRRCARCGAAPAAMRTLRARGARTRAREDSTRMPICSLCAGARERYAAARRANPRTREAVHRYIRYTRYICNARNGQWAVTYVTGP